MADNCAENKNNIVFAFMAELVTRGWYDEIQMLFGPVGHTHNGNDAVHFVHNNIAGNYVSITPAELFHNYKFAWHDATTRPQPVIVESQLDWGNRYLPYLRGVRGFTRTTNDVSYVRAFRFTRNECGQSEMHVKGSPSNPEWFGMDSVPNAPGFPVLSGIPDGMPKYKQPDQYKIPDPYINHLNSDKMVQYANDTGRGPMHADLMRMARTLCVPSQGPVSERGLAKLDPLRRKKMAGWGTVEMIGVPSCISYIVPFIRPKLQDAASFWLVPSLQSSSSIPMPSSRPLGIPTPFVLEVRRRPPKPRKQKAIPSRTDNVSSSSSEHEVVSDWIPQLVSSDSYGLSIYQ